MLLPGIMEHVERSGIHSGDSIAIYPALHLTSEIEEKIAEITKKLCRGLNAIGIVNVQYLSLIHISLIHRSALSTSYIYSSLTRFLLSC